MDEEQEKYYNRPSKKSSLKIVAFAIIALIILLVIVALFINQPIK